MDSLFDQRRYLIPFRSSLLPQIFTDVLVIGGGVAGLRAAIAAADAGADVIVLLKGEAYESNTAWAQGGIATAGMATRASAGGSKGGTSTDDIERHVKDTLECGAGLCDEAAVRLILSRAAGELETCLAWGLELDRDASGTLLMGREGGHSASRIYHAHGDATGREFQRCLWDRAKLYRQGKPAGTGNGASGGSTGGSSGGGSIRLFDKCFALDLITPGTEPGSPVVGAITHHARYGLQMIWADTTILAAGGAGQVYRESTNPKVATADGLAMAYRAGATLADMAFMQFHPTTLYLPGAPRSLISEAVRGEGAYLLDQGGNRFMVGKHPLAELAPRDIVARAIVDQIAQHGGRVWLDCRHLKGFDARFPGIAAELRKYELDAGKDLIPVHPAAHYMVGGVRTDLDAKTNVPGLMAIGEASCTGLHGANRLASNSLLEGLVMGEVAGRLAAASKPLGGKRGPSSIVSDIRPPEGGELDLADVRSSLRSAMWRNVGIERTGTKLADAVRMLEFWGRYTLDKIFDEPAGWETQNMLLVGWLMARSAAWREESRGCHERAEFAGPRADFAAHDGWRRGRAGVEKITLG